MWFTEYWAESENRTSVWAHNGCRCASSLPLWVNNPITATVQHHDRVPQSIITSPEKDQNTAYGFQPNAYQLHTIIKLKNHQSICLKSGTTCMHGHIWNEWVNPDTEYIQTPGREFVIETFRALWRLLCCHVGSQLNDLIIHFQNIFMFWNISR